MSSSSNNIPSGFFAVPTTNNYRFTGGASTTTPSPPPPPPPGSTTFGFNYNYNPSSRQNVVNKSYTKSHNNNNRTRGYQVNLKNQQTQLPWVPTAKQYRCNACNLNLESASNLETHVRTAHVKCNHCDFMAAPHVIQGHVRVEHGQTTTISNHYGSSGFKTITVAVSGCPVQRFRICVGNKTEDIQLWIAERRKRFPRRNASLSNTRTTTQEQNVPTNTTTNVKPSVGGLSTLLAGYSSSSSSSCDDDGDVVNSDNEQEVTTSSKKRNATLMEEHRNETEVQASQDTRLPANTTQPLCRYFSRNGTCRNGDRCRFRHEHHQQHYQTHDFHPKDRDRPTKLPKNDRLQTLAKMNPNTSLLQKLLANDVKRETILTLQILDFIFESKFLSNVSSLQSSDKNYW